MAAIARLALLVLAVAVAVAIGSGYVLAPASANAGGAATPGFVYDSVPSPTTGLGKLHDGALRSYDDPAHASRASLRVPRRVVAAEAGATTRWLRGTAGNAGPVPASVAAALRGQTFSSPKQFREAFWRAAAADPSLAGQFSASNVTRMGKGLAPRVVPSQRLGGQGSYILHHRTPLNRGGAPYDPDNILVVTPRYHKEVLEPGYHYGGGG